MMARIHEKNIRLNVWKKPERMGIFLKDLFAFYWCVLQECLHYILNTWLLCKKYWNRTWQQANRQNKNKANNKDSIKMCLILLNMFPKKEHQHELGHSIIINFNLSPFVQNLNWAQNRSNFFHSTLKVRGLYTIFLTVTNFHSSLFFGRNASWKSGDKFLKQT